MKGAPESVKVGKKSAEKVVVPPAKAPVAAPKEEKKNVGGAEQGKDANSKNEKANAVVENKKKVDPAQGKAGLKIGEELTNCGVTSECTDGAFPVHLFTGLQARELPKICVNGK